MKRLAIILPLLLALLLSGPVGASKRTAPPPPPKVEVLRNGASFTATFHFTRQANRWAFVRSALARRTKDSWRLRSWKVLTPGVSLLRQGDYDVLVAAAGPVPQTVRIRFEPFADDLLADYDPALAFTDGTMALFTGHFAAVPWPRASQSPDEKLAVASITFNDRAGTLLYKGRQSGQVRTSDLATYVVFGTPRLLENENLSGIIDPQIPAWLSGELVLFLPRSLALYGKLLGPPAGSGRPMVLVSWAGPTAHMTSQGGSVLPNLVTVRLEGDGLLERSPDQLQQLRWFIAHESAHFWLGQAVRYSNPGEAWITEGGANLMAYRLIESIDPTYSSGFELYKDWSDCVSLSKDKPIGSAGSRSEQRAYYACGSVFAMIAEGAAQKRGRNFFNFSRDLIATNRQEGGGNGEIAMDEWLAALTRESDDPTIAEDMRQMLTKGVADPRAVIASMLQRVGRKAPG